MPSQCPIQHSAPGHLSAPQGQNLACPVHAVSPPLAQWVTPGGRVACCDCGGPPPAGRGAWASQPRARRPPRAQAPPRRRLSPPPPGRRHWPRAPPPSASHFLAEPWLRTRPAPGLRRPFPAAPRGRPRRRGSPRRGRSAPARWASARPPPPRTARAPRAVGGLEAGLPAEGPRPGERDPRPVHPRLPFVLGVVAQRRGGGAPPPPERGQVRPARRLARPR